MARTAEVGRNQDIIGVIPYIRIHDHILKKAEIISFEIESSDFLPTMTLRVKTPSSTLNDSNKFETGDLVSVGIRADLKVFRPIVVDFLATTVIKSGSGLGKKHGDRLNEYYIEGVLNTPNLKTEDIGFSYQGFAEDALKDGAKRVGLGYVENDNPRTPSTKKETWKCYDNVNTFFKDVTKHMWAGKDSFFDSWIDFYMNLININVSDMLGRKIEDDGIMDFTKYRSIVDTAAEDGKYVHNDLDPIKDYKDNKLFCNDKGMQTSIWFVNDYYTVNHATEITRQYGVQNNLNVYIKNNGLGQSENNSKFEINIGVFYNYEKIQLGYTTFNGPSEADFYYKKADNGNWKNQNIKKVYPMIAPIQSDGDEDSREGGKNNKETSGNYSKEYFIAPFHNEINLAELKKQNVILRTTGFNNSFARGEKVPCVLYKQTDTKFINPNREIPDNSFMLDAECSGWFYVQAVKYIYKPSQNRNNATSDWVTETTLTRREWMPPEPVSSAAAAGDVNANIGHSSTDATSVAAGTTQANDVTANTKDASQSNKSSSNTPTDNVENVTQGNNTEASPMEEEVAENIEGQEKNEEAIAAVDSAEKTEETLEEEKEVAEEAEKTPQLSPITIGTATSVFGVKTRGAAVYIGVLYDSVNKKAYLSDGTTEVTRADENTILKLAGDKMRGILKDKGYSDEEIEERIKKSGYL